MQNFNFLYSATLQKSGSEKNGRIPITIIPNRPSFDRQNDKVILKAFNTECRDEFLKDGVIDYDHLSMLGKDPLTKAQAIIGEPEDLYVKNGTPYCEAFLFKGNPFVDKSIIPALESKSRVFGASIGGRVLKKSIEKDSGGNIVGNIFSKIRLKHIAICPLQKAVHQGTSISLRKSEDGEEMFTEDFEILIKSLTDSEVMKALTAGSATDISQITGGQVLQPQSLEGAKRKVDRKKIRMIMPFVIENILNGTLKGNSKNYEDYLMRKGLNKYEARQTSRLVAANAHKIVKLTY